MKTWVRFCAPILFFSFLFLFNVPALARQGCCSHHGGVCGCGCCDGTPLSSTCAPYYPECSGGSTYIAPISTPTSKPAPTYIIPTATPTKKQPTPTLIPVSTATPAKKPTVIPTLRIEPTEIPTEAVMPTEVLTIPPNQPEVLGYQDEGESKEVEPPTLSDSLITLGILGLTGFGGYRGLRSIKRKLFG